VWKVLAAGAALVGLVIAAVVLRGSGGQPSRADQGAGATAVAQAAARAGGAPTPGGTEQPSPAEPALASAVSGLSPYQAQIAGATLHVLDGMEQDARARGETRLLARVQTERAHVIRAAAGLPRTALQERNAQ
jgi:hypothetical protein